jgi:hypothetical protein
MAFTTDLDYEMPMNTAPLNPRLGSAPHNVVMASVLAAEHAHVANTTLA